jgi:hypothetical protein
VRMSGPVGVAGLDAGGVNGDETEKAADPVK